MKEIIKKVPPPGFEPGSRAFLVPPVLWEGARKARILGRAILRRLIWNMISYSLPPLVYSSLIVRGSPLYMFLVIGSSLLACSSVWVFILYRGGCPMTLGVRFWFSFSTVSPSGNHLSWCYSPSSESLLFNSSLYAGL